MVNGEGWAHQQFRKALGGVQLVADLFKLLTIQFPVGGAEMGFWVERFPLSGFLGERPLRGCCRKKMKGKPKHGCYTRDSSQSI